MLRLRIPQAEASFQKMALDVKRASQKGLDAAAVRLQKEIVREIRRQKLVDRAALIGSVRVEPDLRLARRVVVDVPYAYALNYGARPFMPPIAPLRRWALRKGIAKNQREATAIAWGIAKKYQLRGTKPRRFLQNALKRAEKKMRADMVKYLAKMGYGWKGTIRKLGYDE